MNSTVLITGAASGIGLELAKLAAQDGSNLVLIDIQETKLLEVQHQFQELYAGRRMEAIVEDLTLPDAATRIYQHLQERQIPIDVLINNAGIGSFGKFATSSWERENRVLQIHVQTLTHLTKLFLPEMIRRGKGHIMNVASLTAFFPGPFNAVYFASKAYVLSFSQALANEVEGTGVTVTVLCPGLTNTNIIHSTNTDQQALLQNNLLTASAEEVARFGYEAMKKGKMIAIPRLINRLMAFAPRLISRKMLVRIVRKGQGMNRGDLGN